MFSVNDVLFTMVVSAPSLTLILKTRIVSVDTYLTKIKYSTPEITVLNTRLSPTTASCRVVLFNKDICPGVQGLIPTELAKRKRASSRLPVIGSWYGLPAPKWKDDWERIQ